MQNGVVQRSNYRAACSGDAFKHTDESVKADDLKLEPQSRSHKIAKHALEARKKVQLQLVWLPKIGCF